MRPRLRGLFLPVVSKLEAQKTGFDFAKTRGIKMQNRSIAGALSLCLLLPAASAEALEQIYVQSGKLLHPAGKSLLDDIEIGAGWALPWQSDDGKWRSRVDLGLGFTNSKSDDAWRLMISPVLRYQPWQSTFFELGVGLAYISKTLWAPGHDMGGHWQFENRLGVGHDFGNFELSLNLTHYSNGGLQQQNPGAEMLGIRFARKF